MPEALIGNVLAMLRQRFGAVSFETQTIRGLWQDENDVYRDDLVRIFADVADDEKTRMWFVALKERLKREFQQIDIWITTHPIEVL